MDLLTFSSKVIDSLAWPVATLILGLVFRRRVLDLIPSIKKLKAGSFEAEFDFATKQMLANALEAKGNNESSTTGSSSERRSEKQEFLTNLVAAHGDPTGMILRGWSKVDAELFQLGQQFNLVSDPQLNSRKLFQTVMGADVLPNETKRLIRELRDLRNQVAHSKIAPSAEAAQNYLLAVDRVLELIRNFRKNLPHYR